MKGKAVVLTCEIKLQRYKKVSVSLRSPLGELAYSHILLNIYLALLFSLLLVFTRCRKETFVMELIWLEMITQVWKGA